MANRQTLETQKAMLQQSLKRVFTAADDDKFRDLLGALDPPQREKR